MPSQKLDEFFQTCPTNVWLIAKEEILAGREIRADYDFGSRDRQYLKALLANLGYNGNKHKPSDVRDELSKPDFESLYGKEWKTIEWTITDSSSA